MAEPPGLVGAVCSSLPTLALGCLLQPFAISLQEGLSAGMLWRMTHAVTVEFGDDVLLATGQSPSEFADEARLLLAAKLYELGRLSSGQAAKLCAMGRVEFLLALPRIGVKVSNMSAEDADDELSYAQHG
jgi:predicted HTH domain antitoxin